MCVCIYVSAPEVFNTSGVMWHDLDSVWLVNIVLQLYMTAVVDIVSWCGLSIDVHCRNEHSKSKLAMYSLLLSL